MEPGSVETLLKIATENGAIIDDRISFQQTDNSGISAFADINKGEHRLSIEIPRSLIIKPEDAYTDLGVKAGDFEQTSIFKLYVASLKLKLVKNDIFQPYINLLPTLEDIGSPLSLSEDVLYIYENTTLQTSYISEKLKLLHDEFSTVAGISKQVVQFQDYLWAHLITTSRAFPYRIINPEAQPHEIMLLPIIDLLNHKPNSKVEWSSNDAGNFKITCFLPEDQSETKVEVFNNYGPKGNAELLMGYGFVIEDNEYDSLQLSLSLDGNIKKGLNEDWHVKLPTITDYTYSINDQKSLESSSSVNDNGFTNDKTIFMLNKYHPIPTGLLEVFAYVSKNQTDKGMTLKSIMNGLNKLKQSLEIKYNDKLDKMPSFDESRVSTTEYMKAKEFRKGQLKIYNLTKAEIKNREKTFLKDYRKNFITIKDIIRKDDDFSEFLELLRWDKDVSDLNKMEMELISRLWLLKCINYAHNDTPLNTKWVSQLFESRKEMYLSGKISQMEADEFMVDMYNQIIPALSDNAPELLKGDQWELSDWLIVDELMLENSYEKGKSLEPLIIQPLEL